jgi:hypothetical protein
LDQIEEVELVVGGGVGGTARLAGLAKRSQDQVTLRDLSSSMSLDEAGRPLRTDA